MPVWTPGERRGALLVALLLALGAARDLWRATHPALTPAPVEHAARAEGTPGPSGDGARTPLAAAVAGRVVDINRAGPAELDALPGIGPVLAARIISHRNAHGPFRDAEDLLAVPGIGPRLLERLRPLVRTGPFPDSTAAATPPRVAFGNLPPGGRVQIPVQEAPAGGR